MDKYHILRDLRTKISHPFPCKPCRIMVHSNILVSSVTSTHILKGILGTAGGVAPSAPAETEAWYRVRKTWADASSQKGAFKSLENARKCADENPGYSVFDETGKVVYTREAAFKPYLVRVSIPDLNIRKGSGTDHGKTGKYTGIGTFTIVEEADGKGASKWGLLKSYQSGRNGWVSLDFAERV